MEALKISVGALIPFFGTVCGALCVFLLRAEMNRRLTAALSGFAAGIMTAASVWSLLIPAIDRCSDMGFFAFLPAVCGLMLGMLFLMAADRFVPWIAADRAKQEHCNTAKMLLAITLHNLPEGMAVGAAFAGLLLGETGITTASAMGLSIGVALQNIPEGAIVSMPLKGTGLSRRSAFWYGAMSGAVEPIGAILTILAAGAIVPILPILLGFAAGAMLCVVVEELIPDVAEGGFSKTGALCFLIGFAVMMSLDVALG